MDALLPANEEGRLKKLRGGNLLDTPNEASFDALAVRAAEICETPIATISLVDENRQWFKAKVGLDASETSREVAFCSHTILQDDIMVVPDALADERFAQNPLVTGSPNIRFYAGMPIITADGYALGTLCVIDRRPRELTADQLRQLKTLAQSCRTLMEMRTSTLGGIFEKCVTSTTEGVTIADAREPDMPLIFANDAFYSITGYSETDVIGRNCRFLQGEKTDPAGPRKIREAIQAQKNAVVELLNYTKERKPFWNRVTIVPIFENAGEMAYVVGLQGDLTESKEAEAARQQLLGMTTTMNSVNDTVLNFMNQLQVYRIYMEERWKVDSEVLQKFDCAFADTLAKLSKINALTKFKSRSVARGVLALDVE